MYEYYLQSEGTIYVRRNTISCRTEVRPFFQGNFLGKYGLLLATEICRLVGSQDGLRSPLSGYNSGCNTFLPQ